MKKLFAISLFMLTLALVNCKDESTDDPTPAKTLNKSLLTDKYWVCEGVTDHYFRSDGKYCNPSGTVETGTWQWLNNSDSLEVVDFTGRYVWYVKYCTETEMSARNGNDPYLVFKKQ
jgi:hypothetical protein